MNKIEFINKLKEVVNVRDIVDPKNLEKINQNLEALQAKLNAYSDVASNSTI